MTSVSDCDGNGDDNDTKIKMFLPSQCEQALRGSQNKVKVLYQNEKKLKSAFRNLSLGAQDSFQFHWPQFIFLSELTREKTIFIDCLC